MRIRVWNEMGQLGGITLRSLGFQLSSSGNLGTIAVINEMVVYRGVLPNESIVITYEARPGPALGILLNRIELDKGAGAGTNIAGTFGPAPLWGALATPPDVHMHFTTPDAGTVVLRATFFDELGNAISTPNWTANI